MDALRENDVNTTEWIEVVTKNVQAMRFGVVLISVHESRVVQIEKTEKVRLERRDTKDSH